MNKRTATLWLPALTNLAVAMGLLVVLRAIDPRPYIVWVGRIPLVLYLPWLVVLPVPGAVAAHLSGLAGGNRRMRLIACFFPVMVSLSLISLGVIAPSAIRGYWPHRWVDFVCVFTWVLLPGLSLLAGALPFLRAPKACGGIGLESSWSVGAHREDPFIS